MSESEITQAQRHLSSIRDFIRWGASAMNAAELFFGHGTDNAIDEAAQLVLHALHLPPQLPDSYLSAVLTTTEKARVCALLTQRIEQRKPAAYLTQQAWFMQLPFYVDERVLIPRSPLAELIEQRFMPWLTASNPIQSILDLCTGSGCIGIACAYAFEQAEVDLSDLSNDALAVAQRNIEQHDLHDRVQTHCSDLFSALNKRYDLIISNPPYVDAAELSALPAEYQHEPALGLAAGDCGLDVVIPLLHQAGDYLTEHGLLVVEVGNAQQALCEHYPEIPFLWPEFEHGGDGVFILSAEQLSEYADHF